MTIQGLIGGPSPLSRIATGKGDKQRSVTADAVRPLAQEANSLCELLALAQQAPDSVYLWMACAHLCSHYVRAVSWVVIKVTAKI